MILSFDNIDFLLNSFLTKSERQPPVRHKTEARFKRTEAIGKACDSPCLSLSSDNYGGKFKLWVVLTLIFGRSSVANFIFMTL